MAKSNAVGTSLKVGTSTSAVAVGGLKSISGVELSAENIDVTDLANSTGYRSVLPSFKDGGEVALEGFFDGDDAGQEALYELMADGDSDTFVITFPTAIGKKWTFTGIVTKFATGFDVDDAVTFSCTVKVSGAPVLADAT